MEMKIPLIGENLTALLPAVGPRHAGAEVGGRDDMSGLFCRPV
jgi:hypothetical protein